MRRVLVALALLVLLPASVVAAPPTVRSSVWVSRGDATATIETTRHSGWYRFVLQGTGKLERHLLLVEFQTGDPEINYYGRIRELEVVNGQRVVRRSVPFDYRYDGSSPTAELCSVALGACTSSASVVFGAKNAEVEFSRLTDGREYRFRGAAKIAREAYIYGRWLRMPDIHFQG